MGKRDEHRRQTMERILDAARRQLGEVGAAGLSLRSVAREVGMVSSAVYRYVSSRDELLTLLIVEAYDSLGDAVDRANAGSTGRPDAERWVTATSAIRRWALDRPHEYLLLYGTPVPGYAAPEDTVTPGIRPVLALVSIVATAHESGRLAAVGDGPPIPPETERQLLALAATADAPIAAETALAFLDAWTQTFGLVGFELTNQTRNMVDDDEALFLAASARMAHHIGLR